MDGHSQPIIAPLPDDVEQALRVAEASVRDGRVVDHGDVRRWLLSWGAADELPAPGIRS